MGFGETFSALSDPIRRNILVLLRDNKKTAGELSENLKLTPPATSYHLKKLKNAELIREKKFKNYIYYELNTSILEELLLWIENLRKDTNEDRK